MIRANAILAAALLAVAAGCTQPGESCQTDSECGGDLVCTRAPDGPSSGPGVCAPRLGTDGDLCEQTADCRSDLFCSNDVAAEPERYGVCTPTRAAGEACRRDANCQTDLVCAPPATGDLGACAPPAG